jgi:4-oxalocrotonate tautomerase
MPYLNANIAAVSNDDTRTKVALCLTDLTASLLHKKRELTAVNVHFNEPAQWFIGGQSMQATEQTTFYVEIKVTEGTNTKNEKAHFVAQVFSAMEALLGKLAPASYVVITEVRADAWGYEGLTQEQRYIQSKTV